MATRNLILLVLLPAACRRPTAPKATEQADKQLSPQATAAPTQSPSPVSHGEAPIGPALTAPDRAADAPAPSKQTNQHVGS
jgi:hypothetical protein